MLAYLTERLKSYIHTDNVMDTDFKYSKLPDNLSLEDINISQCIWLNNKSILTPAEQSIRLEEVLQFNFGK